MLYHGLIVLLSLGVAFGAPDWNSLRVTWSANPLSSWGFDKMPRSLSEKHDDWTLRDDQCASPSEPNAKFLGKRYWYKNDPALTLLFDAQGTIAGIQTSLPKSTYTPPGPVKDKNFVDDGDYWTLTAYFVDPSTICSQGRPADQLQSEGTGTALYLQMGQNPITDSVKIATSEEEVKKTPWKFGHCFWTMGNHYWYNVTKDMSCDRFIPYCLMYNKGKLTAFCFSANSVQTSPRFEHPTAQVANKFIDPVPDCFFTDPTYKKTSTIHIYLIDNPRTGSFC